MRLLCILFFMVVAFIPISMLGCTCFPPGPIDVIQYNSTHLVFVGEAEDVTIDNERGERVITFRIIENIKTFRKGKMVKIVTALESATCGLGIQKGTIWYIWSSKASDGTYRSNICTRSMRLSDESTSPESDSRYAKDMKFIRELKQKRGVQTYQSQQGSAKGKLRKACPVRTWKYFDADGKFLQECVYKKKGREYTCNPPNS